MGDYKKFAAQLAATVGLAVAAALTDNVITLSEQVNILIVLLGAIGVLGAGNLPAGVWKYAKGYVAAATAAAVFIASAMSDGISGAEWIQAGLAALGAIGVIALPGPVLNGQIYRGAHEA